MTTTCPPKAEKSQAVSPKLVDGELAPSRLRIVQVEANLLQFPFFALQTKGLKERKGIEVTGVKNDQAFRLRVSRNTDTAYPGPLSRKLHYALLSIVYDKHRGDTPIENPIRFSWRELAERAKLAWAGGRMIPRMKRAIEATHGVVIRTSHALITREPSGKKPMPTCERGYHLYEKYYFANDVLPDGTVASENQLWLSDWYVENLSSLYSGPIKYDLWLDLNQRPIASRLYEFLMFKFSAKIPKLIINYETLAPFLPVRTEPRLSWAKKQLAPAIADLENKGVVKHVDWTESRDGKIQLHFHPGPALRRGHAIAKNSATLPDSAVANASIRELPHSESPTESLVRAFHRLWSGNSNLPPSKGELETARKLIGEYGLPELDAEMKHVVARMKVEFPTAKTFSAAARFVPQIIELRRKDLAGRERQRLELEKAAEEEQELRQIREKKRARREHLLKHWLDVAQSSQQSLHDEFVASIPYDAVRSYQAKKNDLSNPTNELLDYYATSTGLPLIAA